MIPARHTPLTSTCAPHWSTPASSAFGSRHFRAGTKSTRRKSSSRYAGFAKSENSSRSDLTQKICPGRGGQRSSHDESAKTYGRVVRAFRIDSFMARRLEELRNTIEHRHD